MLQRFPYPLSRKDQPAQSPVGFSLGKILVRYPFGQYYSCADRQTIFVFTASDPSAARNGKHKLIDAHSLFSDNVRLTVHYPYSADHIRKLYRLRIKGIFRKAHRNAPLAKAAQTYPHV